MREKINMPVSKGSKIVAPFVRATSSSGLIHAVKNADVAEGEKVRTVCGNLSRGADQPVKRFQSGIEGVCGKCYAKVVVARAERISERKASNYEKSRSDAVMRMTEVSV